MNSEYIERELRGFFSEEVRQAEPSVEWWDRLISGITIKAPRTRTKSMFSKTRLLLIAALISVIAIGGTIYGYDFFVKDLFKTMAPSIEDIGLAEELNMSQTIGGVTVKLERAYADANVVIVGYSVTGSKRNYYEGDIEVSSADGANLRKMLGLGQPVGPDSIIGEWQPDLTVFVDSFDAPAASLTAQDMPLRLKLSVSTSANPDDTRSTVGPFVFDFTIPNHGGTTIDVNQAAEASDITIGLGEVTISPWGIKSVFQVPASYLERRGGCALVCFLKSPDGTTKSASLGGIRDTNIVEYFSGDFAAQKGQWTVTINEIVLPNIEPGYHPASDTLRIAGPWVFTFSTE